MSCIAGYYYDYNASPDAVFEAAMLQLRLVHPAVIDGTTEQAPKCAADSKLLVGGAEPARETV